MDWLPGWNSAEGAGWWSSFHFWFGIACLVLLSGSEVLSHVYSLRKDELVAAAESAAGEQRQKKQNEDEARRTSEMEALQKKATDAEAALAKIKTDQAGRRLSENEIREFSLALLPFKGQKFTMTSVMGDGEGRDLAEQLLSVTDAAGWDHNSGAGVATAVFNKDPIGVVVQVNGSDAAANRVQAAQTLLENLKKYRLVTEIRGEIGPQLQVGYLGIIVGRKPQL